MAHEIGWVPSAAADPAMLPDDTNLPPVDFDFFTDVYTIILATAFLTYVTVLSV